MFNISRIFRAANIKVINGVHPKSTRCFLNYEDIPQPKSLPLIGTKLDLIAAGSGARLHEYVNKRHKALGVIFREKIGDSEIIFVSDPQMIKDVFLKLEGKYPEHIVPEPWALYEKLYGSTRGLFFMHGEEWYYNRKIMNKLVLKESSESWLEFPITEVVKKFIKTWIKRAEKGSITPDTETEFYRLSIEVLLGVLLGSNSSIKRTSYHEELLIKFAGEVKKIFVTTTKLYALPVSLCQRLNLKVWRDFKESVDVSLSLAQKLVRDILAAKDLGNGLIQKLQTENMKEEDISRIVSDFVIAAGDTTSYTLLWTLYLIAKNKGIIEELQKVNNENMVKYILKESMRLYPVAPFLTRILPQDCFLGSYHIQKTVPVVASIYTTGRDETYFSQANEFIPLRWDRKDTKRHNLEYHEPSASLPFALGARSCVGKKIAMIQLTAFIQQIVETFDFECQNKEEMHGITSQVLIPEKTIKLIFKLKN